MIFRLRILVNQVDNSLDVARVNEIDCHETSFFLSFFIPSTAHLKNGILEITAFKAYVEEKYGFKVSTLYIAQMKDKVGMEKRKNYNPGSGEGKVPICPPEKEAAIMDAFRHFNLI